MKAESDYLHASLQALAAARSAPGPEWVRDLYWQVAAGLMGGDEAVAILLDRHRREHPEAFGSAR